MTTATSAPFPGLRPFEPDESSIFFGRGQHIGAMIRILREHRFLAVVGASGSGKSSLVRAGLLPAIAEGSLGGENWRFVIMRPGESPHRNLAEAVICATEFEPSSGAVPLPPTAEDVTIDEQRLRFRTATLRKGPHGLIDTLADSPLQDDAHVVVLVDQFEEILRFRQTGQEENLPDESQLAADAVAFVDMLLSSLQSTHQNLYIIMTMRSDYLGDCDAFHGLPEAINKAQFLAPRLTRDQLSDAITRPLRQFGCDIEPAVVTQLLNSVGTDPDQLPLLQDLLLRMWRMATRESPDESTSKQPLIEYEKHYLTCGGFEASLDSHADDVYQSLADDDQATSDEDAQPSTRQRIARRLFVALAERSPKGHLTRRLVTIREVADESAAVAEVVDVFRQKGCHFLVTSPSGELTPDTTMDISHESLLRQWTRLNNWVNEEAASAATFTRLRDAAMRWPDQEPLLRDPALSLALEWRDREEHSPVWANRYGGGLDRALQFLIASEEERQQEEDRAEAERRRELKAAEERAEQQRQLAEQQGKLAEQQRKRAEAEASSAKRFRNGLWISSILAVAVGVIAIYASVQRSRVQGLIEDRQAFELENNRIQAENETAQIALGEIEGKLADLSKKNESIQGENETAQIALGEIEAELADLAKKQERQQIHNDALSAIGDAYGSVKPLGDGSFAVRFSESEVSPDGALALLPGAFDARSLDLSHTSVSDAGLEPIKALQGLKSLNLGNTQIKNVGVTHLSEIEELTDLKLNDTLIRVSALPTLERLTSLKTLDISRTRVHQSAVDGLREKLPMCEITYSPDPLLAALSENGDWEAALDLVGGSYFERSVDFFDSMITNAALVHLQELENIQEISLSYCTRIDNAGLANLKWLPELKSVKLSYCTQITDAGISHLLELPKLESVNLDDINLSDYGLGILGTMSQLKRLRSNGNAQVITDAGVASLVPHPGLQFLDLSFTNITDIGVAHLKSFKQVKSLTLKGGEFDGSGFQDFEDFEQLMVLDLTYNSNMTEDNLRHLKNMPNLRTLELRGVAISDAGLVHLEGFSSLVELDLVETKVTDAGVAKLRKLLPNCHIMGPSQE